MSSSNVKSRYRYRSEPSKHSNLCTQQRRLRHLTCIVGRNIATSLIPQTRHSGKNSLLSLYYTLHASDDFSKVLYRSETIEDTLNPNWREFDYHVFSENESYTKASVVTVCVWGARRTTKFRIILRYDVNFSGLVYCREQLRSHDQSYETDSLLFRMFGGYYIVKSWKKPPDNTALISQENTLSHYIKVPQDQVRLSYKKASLLRAHFTLKAIHQTRLQVTQVKQRMQELLIENETRRSKHSLKESYVFKTNLLRQELERLKQQLIVASKETSTKAEAVTQRTTDLESRKDGLEQYISDMKIRHSAHIERRETLLKVNAHLNFRRRQLAAELSYIYPILELPFKEGKDGHKRLYAVCGVRLPNSEDFVGEDDTMLAVAIGNTAHLVYMMAKLMELPLRYPIRPMGSRSSVVDVVTDKLSDKQREFPLYLKGKEKFQFHYGVFLLNKNIAQIRYHNGLGTADLRNTLPNLKQLLEAKYGVRIVVKTEGIHPSTLSKAALLDSRRVSLPLTSSPNDRLNHNLVNHMSNLDEEDGKVRTENLGPAPRPRSEVLTSGLPSVHVKAQQQHRFLSRKGSSKKLQRPLSMPETEMSPDLITVPFEDLVQRTVDGHFVSRSHGDTLGSIRDSNNIDRGEDCLHEQEDSYVTVHETAQVSRPEDLTNRVYQRQFSETDALIIPDPFEREADDTPMSPTTDLMV